MGVAAVVRTSSMRDIKWPVWVLLALAAIVLVYGVTQSGFQLGSFTWAAPLVFAAAVAYVRPPDIRFVWGAVLLGLPHAIGTIAAVFPDIWFDVVPGDWKNATPLLIDLGGAAVEIARVLELIGLFLLGFALGGVRTVLSIAIIGAGVLLGALNVVEFLGLQIEGMPIEMTVRSIVFPLLYAGGWAFVFAAALESRRRLMTIGTGLLFALVAVDILNFYQPVPGDLLLLGTAILSLIGWVVMIVSPLRGELSASPSRTNGAL